jgi:hypothetical protein
MPRERRGSHRRRPEHREGVSGPDNPAATRAELALPPLAARTFFVAVAFRDRSVEVLHQARGRRQAIHLKPIVSRRYPLRRRRVSPGVDGVKVIGTRD